MYESMWNSLEVGGIFRYGDVLLGIVVCLISIWLVKKDSEK